MLNPNRIILLIGLLASLAFGAAAQDPSSPTDITLLLDFTPNTNHTGIYVAQELGYYAEAGLNVTVREPIDLLPESALDAGVVEFGIGFQEFTSSALANDADIVSIAAIIQSNTSGFASIAADHPLDAPADLASLTYGGFSFPSLENAILGQFIACTSDNEAQWDDANYQDIGFTDPIALMRRDRIDFAWIYYGWQGIQAEVQGTELDIEFLSDYPACLPDYYTPILLTTGTLIDENPELVRAFTEATARGYALAIEDPARAAELLLQAVPELDEALVRRSAEWLAPRYQGEAERWGQQSQETWQTFTDFLVENGIIETRFDVEAAFTNDFLPPLVEAETTPEPGAQ